MVTTPTRRTVLKGIGAGTALLAAPVGASSAEEDEAGLRVAHASPDAGPVDVLVNGSVEVPGLKFRSVTDYLELAAGEYDIAVNEAGTDNTVFSAEGVTLEAEDYSAVALGEASSDDTTFTVSIFEDTNGANLDDEFRVRAIHASPDAPHVNVTANDGDVPLFEDVAFGESSGYTTAGAGEYDVEIRDASNGEEVFGVDGVTFEDGSTYTAFAVGYLTPDDEPDDGAPGFDLVLEEDKSAPPRGDGDDDGNRGGDGDDDGNRGGDGDDNGNRGGNGRGR